MLNPTAPMISTVENRMAVILKLNMLFLSIKKRSERPAAIRIARGAKQGRI